MTKQRTTIGRICVRFQGASFANIGFLLAFLLLFPALRAYGDTVTFAQFLEAGKGGNDFIFTNSSKSAVFKTKNPQTSSPSVPVSFDFLSFDPADMPADLQGPQAAQMTMSVSTSQPAATFGNFFDQNLYATGAGGVPNYGTITFTRNSPDKELHQTNLLTISFYALAGGLDGVRRGQTATLTADNGSNDNGQTDFVQFSSSYLNFDSGADENLALSFTSANPCFTLYQNVKQVKGGCTQTNSNLLSLLHSFTAAGTGTFASDPQAASIFATPEPQTLWLTLFGLLSLLWWGLRAAILPNIRS